MARRRGRRGRREGGSFKPDYFPVRLFDEAVLVPDQVELTITDRIRSPDIAKTWKKKNIPSKPNQPTKLIHHTITTPTNDNASRSTLPSEGPK